MQPREIFGTPARIRTWDRRLRRAQRARVISAPSGSSVRYPCRFADRFSSWHTEAPSIESTEERWQA